MSTKLWDFFDGEPFMENPRRNAPLAIIGNPLRYRRKLGRGKYEYDYVSKRKKGKKSMARRVKRHTTKRRKSGRKGRKNAFPMAGVIANPRRRSHSRRRVVHLIRNRRRGARKNPVFMGLTLPPLKQVLYGAAGFIAPPMVEGYINRFLPTSITSTTLGRYAVKLASVVGLTFLAKKAIGQEEAKMVAIGGGTYILVSAVNEFMPSLTIRAYRQGMINSYHSGTINGYAMPNLARNLPSLAAPVWGARNASAIDSSGGVNVIAQRFRRFQ